MRPIHLLRVWVSQFWALGPVDMNREAGWDEVLLTVGLFAIFWWVAVVAWVWMQLENRV